jgi:hypothetical protein
MTTRRYLTGVVTTLWLAGGEGAGSSGRGAAPKLGEALGYAQGSGKAVSRAVHGGRRWRRTWEEIVTHRSGQGDLGADEMQRGRVPFIVARVERMEQHVVAFSARPYSDSRAHMHDAGGRLHVLRWSVPQAQRGVAEPCTA